MLISGNLRSWQRGSQPGPAPVHPPHVRLRQLGLESTPCIAATGMTHPSCMTAIRISSRAKYGIF